MKKCVQRTCAILLFAVATMSVSATCIDVLDFCYEHGGSELLCNTLYTECIAE